MSAKGAPSCIAYKLDTVDCLSALELVKPGTAIFGVLMLVISIFAGLVLLSVHVRIGLTIIIASAAIFIWLLNLASSLKSKQIAWTGSVESSEIAAFSKSNPNLDQQSTDEHSVVNSAAGGSLAKSQSPVPSLTVSASNSWPNPPIWQSVVIDDDGIYQDAQCRKMIVSKQHIQVIKQNRRMFLIVDNNGRFLALPKRFLKPEQIAVLGFGNKPRGSHSAPLAEIVGKNPSKFLTFYLENTPAWVGPFNICLLCCSCIFMYFFRGFHFGHLSENICWLGVMIIFFWVKILRSRTTFDAQKISHTQRNKVESAYYRDITRVMVSDLTDPLIDRKSSLLTIFCGNETAPSLSVSLNELPSANRDLLFVILASRLRNNCFGPEADRIRSMCAANFLKLLGENQLPLETMRVPGRTPENKLSFLLSFLRMESPGLNSADANDLSSYTVCQSDALQLSLFDSSNQIADKHAVGASDEGPLSS